ncbi:uncharacterized protein LOC122682744 [Cervus elaphus]|uniref:uncharacterized protein LOC122682744 n=1 Tax=Cervus elaphus TaxID=9860 RepID=UPI001CC2C119|nr:uncharacterized protein LOC122682744 [Cervus elaphus]
MNNAHAVVQPSPEVFPPCKPEILAPSLSQPLTPTILLPVFVNLTPAGPHVRTLRLGESSLATDIGRWWSQVEPCPATAGPHSQPLPAPLLPGRCRPGPWPGRWSLASLVQCGHLLQEALLQGLAVSRAFNVYLELGALEAKSKRRKHGLRGRGPRASFLHGTRDLPGPAIEPASPALAGGFLTTGQPGKSWLGASTTRLPKLSSRNSASAAPGVS